MEQSSQQHNHIASLLEPFLKRLDALEAEQKELKAELEDLKKIKGASDTHRLNRTATVSVLQNPKKDIKEPPKKPEPIKLEPKVPPVKKIQSEKKIPVQKAPEVPKQQPKQIKKTGTNPPSKIQQPPKPKDIKVVHPPTKPSTATKREDNKKQEKKQEKKEEKKQEKKVVAKQPIKKDQKKIVHKNPQPIKKNQTNPKTTTTANGQKKEQHPLQKDEQKAEEIKSNQIEKPHQEIPLVQAPKQEHLEFGHEEKIESVVHPQQDNQIEQNLLKQIGGDAQQVQRKALDQHTEHVSQPEMI